MLHRRDMMMALAACGIAPARAAEADAYPLAKGALADNEIARMFKAFDRDLPDVTLTGPGGEKHFSDYRGKTLIVPLWAEWCTPCMSEIGDFGGMQKKYGNDQFQILPVLTGTMKKLTPDLVAQIFGYLHASALEPLIEYRRGDRLMQAMAKDGDHVAIPCNLIIAPSGKTIAREIGILERPKSAEAEAKLNAMNHEDRRQALLGAAERGVALSLWGTAAGDELVSALAGGLLNGK